MAWVIGVGIFLLLLFAFPRAIVGLIILCVVLIGSYQLWMKIEQDERAKKKASVTVTVNYDLERCRPEYPLFVRIQNGADDTVEAVSFGVAGRRAGYSNPIYESRFLEYSSDRIIASGDSWTSCWALPDPAYSASEQKIEQNPPETLVWTVEHTSPSFRSR